MTGKLGTDHTLKHVAEELAVEFKKRAPVRANADLFTKVQELERENARLKNQPLLTPKCKAAPKSAASAARGSGKGSNKGSTKKKQSTSE